ncbi:MAG: DUF1826 domain-containing protein, partial [Pseudomonadota bacterium]|nr:DUF1826 domain-containing protein [Pseudomonadota bacterium]
MNLIEGTHRKPPVIERATLVKTDGRSDAIRSVETCDGLAGIVEPDVALVIWERSLPLSLREWLEELASRQLPNLRVLIAPADIRRAIEPHMDACGMPSGEMRDLLIRDIGELVSTFAEITASNLVDVRLERVVNDACWKFHRDSVETRLLPTYCGPATEWVQPRDAAQAMREQRNYDGQLERLQEYGVAIFKGSRAQ